MSVSNGVITAPVSIADVKSVLGVSANDVYSLCLSDNINWWSKCKPYANGDMFYNYQPANFGWTPAVVNSITEVKELYDDTSKYKDLPLNSWTYNNLGVSYKRLADFENYNHRAACPALGFGGTSETTTSGTMTFSCMYGLTSSEPESGLGMSDFGSLADCYFGVMLYRGTSLLYVKTGTTKLSDGGDLGVTFTGSNWTTGTYKAYPFFSSIQIAIGDAYSVGQYYSLPGVTYAECTIKSTASAYSKFYFEGSYVDGDVTGTLYNKMSQTIKKVYIYIRFSTSKYTDAMVIGETMINVGTMEYGDTYDVLYAALYEDKTYVVDLYADGKYIRRTMLMQELSPE